MKRIAIFASGAGSNAAKILEHFRQSEQIKVELIVCNKPGAGVLNIAKQHKVETLIIEKDPFFRGDSYIPQLTQHQIDWIILAGFLWKIPSSLIANWRGKMLNIHPALLPSYGGKGMYGVHVHQAVIDAGETISGITIHQVDEQYDHGDTVFQASCPVLPNDTAVTLASRIHALEHEHYPRVIEEQILSKF